MALCYFNQVPEQCYFPFWNGNEKTANTIFLIKGLGTKTSILNVNVIYE